LQEWIRPAFLANRGARAMPRMHACLVAEGEQDVSNRRQERRTIPPGQIGPAD
jgi:hypothetical protein